MKFLFLLVSTCFFLSLPAKARMIIPPNFGTPPSTCSAYPIPTDYCIKSAGTPTYCPANREWCDCGAILIEWCPLFIFNKTVAECEAEGGWSIQACAHNKDRVNCVTCETEGYDMTAEECKKIGTVNSTCPKNRNLVKCKTCANMGYLVDKKDCKGRIDATCPYNSSKVKCTTCAQLGYDKTAKECEGMLSTKCPYDSSQMSCISPDELTCEKLGYAMKESQCYSGVIRCPYDTSKVSCIDAYVGEIRIFAGPESKIPNGWIIADGRSLPVSTYRELCNAVSSSCSSTFNIPNLSGRFLVGSGDSRTTGSSSLTRGNTGGTATVTLNTSELPSHQHTIAWGENANENFLLSELTPWGYSYTNKRGSNDSDKDNPWFYTSPVGGGKAHNNMPPYFALYYIIYTGVHS